MLPARQWPSIRVEPETLPAPGEAVEDLETPVLVVDLDRVEANIRFVQAYCEQLGVRNRIHIKTHKIPQIAALQVAAGSAGITVQKLGEAEVFAASGLGFDDIFLPYNLLGAAKLRRLRAFLERYPEIKLSLTCDSAVVAEGLSTVARARPTANLKVWVECDAGLGRAGVTQPRQALDLAGAIERLPGLTFGGLMSFTADAEPSVAFMTAALAVFRSAGRPAPEVTMGGTRQLRWVEQVPGVTEHRPGTYVFHDRQTVLQGGWSFDDCAGAVRTTVVSRPTAERGILDAGSKAITPETMGLDGLLGHIVEYPEARLYRLSEEHGYVDFSAYPESERPQVGDVLAVVPNHICTTVNMYDWLVGSAERPGRGRVAGGRSWPGALDRPRQSESGVRHTVQQDRVFLPAFNYSGTMGTVSCWLSGCIRTPMKGGRRHCHGRYRA